MNATDKFNAQIRYCPTQIPKFKYKYIKKWVLDRLKEDAAENHSTPLSIDEIYVHQMFGNSKEYRLSKEESNLFITNLLKEGSIVPHPLGGYMLKGQTCLSAEIVEAKVKEDLKKLGII